MIRSWNKWLVQSLFEGHSRKVGLFLLLLCSVIGQCLSQESMSVSQTPYRYIVLKSSFIYIWPFVPFLFSPPIFSCFYLILVPVTYACFSLSLLLYFIWKKKGTCLLMLLCLFKQSLHWLIFWGSLPWQRKLKTTSQRLHFEHR